MVRRRFSTLLATVLVLVTLILVILLNLARFRPTGLRTLAEQGAAATPRQIYLPAVQQNHQADNAQQNQEQPTGSPTAIPTTDGMSLPPGWRDTDPEHPNDPNATAEPDMHPTQVPYIPAPTPDVNATTVPELDNIVFTNFRQLQLPGQHPTFYGQVAWSPDSKLFIGFYDGTMDSLGLNISHLYKGSVETGEFFLWSSNGIWPVWSRDGQFVYYLAPRQNGTRFTVAENLTRPYYDLFRRQVNTEKEELLLKDVEPPGVPVAQLAELANGEILKFNSLHQLVRFANATELAKTTIQSADVTALTSLEDLTGKLESAGSIYSSLPPSFSVSRDGKMVVVASPGKPAVLLDLVNRSKITSIDGLDIVTNVAWSSDSNAFVYTNRQGLMVYDLASRETRTLVTNQTLGFHPDDLWSGISSPAWVLGGQVLLFTARSIDWVNPGTESRVEPFIFATTSNGEQWRAVGYYDLESVSPDGLHAIIRQPDSKTGSLTTGETTLWLVDIHH